DSAETDVKLARALVGSRRTGDPVYDDSLVRKSVLTNALAHRGHLREAYALGGTRFPAEFAQLALLGGVPPESARATFTGCLGEPVAGRSDRNCPAPRVAPQAIGGSGRPGALLADRLAGSRRRALAARAGTGRRTTQPARQGGAGIPLSRRSLANRRSRTST